MKLLDLTVGGFDYNRIWGIEFTLLGCWVFVGTGYNDWFYLAAGFDCGRWFCEWHRHWFAKDVPGERFMRMLVRRFAPVFGG